MKYKNNFSFILTERCNWSCEYCDFPSLENPKDTTFQIIKKHMPYISKFVETSFIDAVGGEIGLVDSAILMEFFKYLPDKSVVVSTNGEFLNRNLHYIPSIRDKIKEVWWHLCEEPKKEKLEVDYYDKDIKIVKGIVGVDLKNIIDFIEANPQIKFDYVEYETYSHSNKELYEALKEKENVSKRAMAIIENRIDEDSKKLRKMCSDFNSTVSIDLVNERILYCHKSMQNYITLSKKHLYKRLENFPKDIFSGENSCYKCVRLYAGKYSNSDILITLQNRMTKKHK